MLCLCTTKLLSFHTAPSVVSIIRNLLFTLNVFKTFPIVVFLIRFLAVTCVQQHFWENFFNADSTLCYLFVIPQCCMLCVGRHTFVRRRVGKCTNNVTLRRVRLPMVAVESNKHYIFCVCICSFIFPACSVLAPLLYCRLWPVRLYHIFQHYLIKGKIFGKKVLWI